MNSRGDIIVHIYASSLRNIYLPIPSLAEQQQIVNFLDYKTGECDRFIANRQKQVELLNEQLHFKINQAITKGITALWITVRDSRILSLPYLPFPSCPRWMSKTL
jgi:type I restriction enzyme S subunit